MSYSHPATRQDEWVLKHSVVPGIFVELGAYDGITHSNTLLLEAHGWTGILIEAYGPFAIECHRNRPHCRTEHAFIGSGGLEPFVVGGQYSGSVDRMPQGFLDEHKRRGNAVHLIMTTPLKDVIGTEPIDYLSLDTEGGEFFTLKNWLEAGGSCRLLTVEFRYDSGELCRLEQLCEEHGMFLDEIRGFDLCFMQK